MPQALLQTGEFYNKTRQPEKAMEYINKSIQSDGAYAFAYLKRARLRYEPEDKLADYAEFIRLKPDLVTGYKERGEFLLMNIRYPEDDNSGKKQKKEAVRKNFQNAIHDFSEAIKLEPSNYSFYKQRAELCLLYEKKYGGKEYFNQTLSDIKIFIDFYLRENLPYDVIGNCKTIISNMFHDITTIKQKRYFKAMLKDSVSNSDAYWMAYTMLAETYESEHNYEKAADSYTRMINSNAEGSYWQLSAYYKRSWVYRYMEEMDKALNDCDTIIQYGVKSSSRSGHIPMEIDPVVILTQRAEWFRGVSYPRNDAVDYDKAIADYSMIIEITKTENTENYFCLEAYLNRAYLYVKQNNFDKALNDYDTIINMDTKYLHQVKMAYKNRIAIYKKQGEMEKAFADYVKMSELGVTEDTLGICLDSCGEEDIKGYEIREDTE
jgi:tetratricopeptide (TPR) repeat protein